jgi:hypothetical protein
MQLGAITLRPSTTMVTVEHCNGRPLNVGQSFKQVRKQVPFEPQNPDRH